MKISRKRSHNVTKSDRLKAEAKQNTKMITKREDTLEKELREVNKALAKKTAKTQATNNKLQAAYYLGQKDYISYVRPEVQNNLRTYFALGQATTLDKLQVEANSYLENLITVPNPKVLEIKDDASPVREMENSTMDVAVEATDPAVRGTV